MSAKHRRYSTTNFPCCLSVVLRVTEHPSPQLCEVNHELWSISSLRTQLTYTKIIKKRTIPTTLKSIELDMWHQLTFCSVDLQAAYSWTTIWHTKVEFVHRSSCVITSIHTENIVWPPRVEHKVETAFPLESGVFFPIDIIIVCRYTLFNHISRSYAM